MKEQQLELISVFFNGATLLAIKGDTLESTLIAMKPVCEGIGLNWSVQYKKILRHPVLRACVSIKEMQMPGDDQTREHVFLSYTRLNFWLALLNTNKIPDLQIRSVAIKYQTEVADVLASHFVTKATEELTEDQQTERLYIRLYEKHKALESRAAKLGEENVVQKIKIEELEPKAAVHDQISMMDGETTITTLCKELKLKQRYGITCKNIHNYLHGLKVVHRRGGDKPRMPDDEPGDWLPYQPIEDKGYMRLRSTPRRLRDGRVVLDDTPVFTPKGKLWIAKLIDEDQKRKRDNQQPIYADDTLFSSQIN